MRARCPSRARAGFTINELLFAAAIVAVVLLGTFVAVQRDVRLQRSTLSITVAESRAQSMLYRLERELSDARGETPRTTLTAAAGAGSAVFEVADTLGFPDRGLLLIDRDGGAREVAAYAGLGGPTTFVGAARGEQCTDPSAHGEGAEVLYAGTAEPIAVQTNPPAALWDGRAQEAGGPVFFRGLGSGFSYRVPTDVTGGTEFLDGDDLQWGETVAGVPTLAGWGAIYYAPVRVVREADTGEDLNRDGDATDVFDVGQLRRRTWDTANPGAPATDVGLGPAAILQEQCAWGADLDADGFEDPILLWDAERRTLHVRLFVLGSARGAASIVRRVESVIFLRNVPNA